MKEPYESIDNPRLQTKLKQVFKSQSFLEIIESQRVEIGMPKNGFDDYFKWKKWLNKKGRTKACSIFMDQVWGFALKTTLEFNLNSSDAFWIESYLLFGENYNLNQVGIPIKNTVFTRGLDIEPDFNCSLELDREDIGAINIKIFPSASQREVIDYVKNNWWFIRTSQSLSDKKHPAFRERRMAIRDEGIYKYYKKGHIDGYGRIKKKVPLHISKIGMDNLRKIIIKQKKMRR